MTTPPLRPDTIEKLNSAVYPSFAMVAGMQLDVFTPLKDGPLSVEDLADALTVKPHKLRPLLYALVAAELLTVEDECFSNTPEAAHFLVRGRPAYLGDTYEGRLRRWQATLHTAETIRTGVPQAKVDYAAMSPDQLEPWYRGIHAEAVAAARTLMARHDFSSARHLVDVGGGSGGLALTIADACPQLQATVIDPVTVTPITQRYIDEAGLAERVHVISKADSSAFHHAYPFPTFVRRDAKMASPIIMSSGLVTLMFSPLPSTTVTLRPSHSSKYASSVAPTPSAWAF